MGTSPVIAGGGTTQRRLSWLGGILLCLGLLGHLLAAQAIGGSYVAYRDHIFGFVALCVMAGVVVVGLGWRFWRGRHDISLLILGVIQTLFGLFVYVERFRVHG